MSEKIRFQMRISPDTDSKIKKAMEVDNCQSQNEFVEKALRFYCGYVSANDSLEALPPLLASAIRSSIQDTENRIARLLFKMAVELDMTMNVVAGGFKVSDDKLMTKGAPGTKTPSPESLKITAMPDKRGIRS